MSSKKGESLVSVPSLADDQPSWKRVGMLAVVGFVVGVAWPKLAGVKLGPNAPESAAGTAAGTASASTASPAASAVARPGAALSPNAATPPASSGSPPAAALASPQASAEAASTLAVQHGIVLSCRDDDGALAKGKECPQVAFDAVAVPRLKKLAQCPAAAGADGKLSIILGLDFAGGHVSAEVGKSSTVADPDRFEACAKEAFRGASLAGLAHDRPRYTVQYPIFFGSNAPLGASEKSPPPGGTPVAEEGGATIVWEVAKVRETPKTGPVVARLPRGTKVQVGANQEGWYRIHFTGAGASPSDGWVYRAAIGR